MNNSQSVQKVVNPEVEHKTKIILKTIEQAYNDLRKQQQPGHLSFIHRISLNLEQGKIEEMLTNLISGYLVVKHSTSTKQPHQKYLYISEDRRFLCWKSVEKADQKMMELKKINDIAQGRDLDKMKHSSTLKNSKRNCFILIGESRNLEIQCKDQETAIRITQELGEAIKNSRRMHLSYRF